MKITKEKLIEIIEQEIANTEADSSNPPEEKIKTDVSKVLLYIDKIDNYREYGQLLQKILQHNVEGKEMIMKKLLGSSVAAAIFKQLNS
jgi:hypothetical protein